MSNKRKVAEIILEQWVASLSSKDRSKDSYEDNFDELFYTWHKIGLDFDTAIEMRDDAIKAHYPSESLVRHYYAKWKKQYDSQDEYKKNWETMIRNAAINVFYVWFNPNTEEQIKAGKEEIFQMNEEGKAVAPNGMSKEEYSRMRRYVDSIPLIDVKALRRERLKREAELNDDEDEDLEF